MSLVLIDTNVLRRLTRPPARSSSLMSLKMELLVASVMTVDNMPHHPRHAVHHSGLGPAGRWMR